MKVETVKSVANAAGTIAGSSGIATAIMGYLQANSVVIGVIISFLSFIAYLTFSIIGHKKLVLADENKAYMKHVDEKVSDVEDKVDVLIQDVSKINKKLDKEESYE